MWLRLAACAAFLVVPVAYAQTGTAPSSTLSLDDAIARVATTHPDLRIFDGRRQVLDANLASAALKPPMTLGATIENTLGTGNYRGFSEAELTVTLAGVIERGGKLNARQALALANIDTLAPQREMARLDLLAETAQVLDWAHREFGDQRGALEDGAEWDYDLQAIAEVVTPQQLRYSEETGVLGVQAGAEGAQRYTLSLSLSGTPVFSAALREQFGLD